MSLPIPPVTDPFVTALISGAPAKVIKKTEAGFLTVVTVFLPDAEGYHYETRLHCGYDPAIHDIIDRARDISEAEALYTHQEMCTIAYSKWSMQLKVLLFWVLDRLMNRTAMQK